jgi:hypothetical protein
MRQACAPSSLTFVTESVVLCSRNLLLIFCYSDGKSTPLHVAACGGHTQACQLLIEAEADLDARDQCVHLYSTFVSDFVSYYFHSCPSPASVQ